MFNEKSSTFLITLYKKLFERVITFSADFWKVFEYFYCKNNFSMYAELEIAPYILLVKVIFNKIKCKKLIIFLEISSK